MLQTARLWLHNLGNDHGGSHVALRLVMDSGSQRTYMMSRTRQALNLTSSASEHLYIKTFGTASETDIDCKVVRFRLETLTVSYWK